jgi:hypothetical protein|tara:strand:+ start:16534 stop:16770 length:237 start_codon:yes stop_codon:yes gene_type:complete
MIKKCNFHNKKLIYCNKCSLELIKMELNSKKLKVFLLFEKIKEQERLKTFGGKGQTLQDKRNAKYCYNILKKLIKEKG